MNTTSAKMSGWVLSVHLLSWPVLLPAQPADNCRETVSAQIIVDQGHSWRPPFGLERVGALAVAHVELAAAQAPTAEYHLTAYRDGQLLERHMLRFKPNPSQYSGGGDAPTGRTPFFARASLASIPSELVLETQCGGRSAELARQSLTWPEVEADATARPDRRINPVHLGAILPPHDWLLLARGQTAVIEAAALSHVRDLPNAKLHVWFDGGKPVELSMPLTRNQRMRRELNLPLSSRGDRSILHVRLTDGERELWKKDIRTMVVGKVPRWPTFGAVETKLRYDAPIGVNDSKSGTKLPSIDYNKAWDPRFKDAVVFLPNGTRFVFWRGANYVPFWARKDNRGVSYQFVENLSSPIHHPDGSQEFAEPIKDYELRYSNVAILESTTSRVHVRWVYQGTDYQYNVTGDKAVEDFYFYPDGFGTRVLTVSSAPGSEQEMSEFIVVTPQGALPLEAIPNPVIDILYLDGKETRLSFPVESPPGEAWQPHIPMSKLESAPAVYRVLLDPEHTEGVIYFAPRDPAPSYAYAAIFQHGERVTPTFWGPHWPLTRRSWLGWGAVSDSVSEGPGHNSLLTWIRTKEYPLATSQGIVPDALGRPRETVTKRFAWLIAQTDLSDEALRDWGKSFATPPAIEVTGGRLDFPSYSPERRALRLVAESKSIEIQLTPAERTVNPVFEIDHAPRKLADVKIEGKPLSADAYAWDGATLWIRTRIDSGRARISVVFR